MEWLGFILVLGSLVGVMLAVIDQWRRDRAGFWKAMAEDTSKMETGDKAAGAAADQTTGTSDRTPEKATPTPDTQVDKTKEGDTSDRTPEKK